MYTRNLVPLKAPPAIRIRPGRQTDQTDQIELIDSFTFCDSAGERWIKCPAGYYDGFTIPWIVRVLSADRLNKLMAGIEASMVHDVACQQDIGTRKFRRQLFWRAMDQSNRQFHDGKLTKIDILGAGVHIGSKFLTKC